MPIRSTLQLGQDHLDYGTYTSGSLSAHDAWAISIGARPDAPSSWAKGDPDFANEDGLLLAREGSRSLLAVADAHFGRWASHVILHDLHARLGPIPTSLHELHTLLQALSTRPPEPEHPGGTSLLLSVYDEDTATGFGLSYWDSTFALLGPRGHRRPVPTPQAGIVDLQDPNTLHPSQADIFEFRAEPGDILLAYTDGVDCCHYDCPETAMTPAVFERIFAASADRSATGILRAIVEQALTGVDGNPGGEDNIAAIAVAASHG